MLASQTIKDLPSHYKPYPHRFKVKVEPFRVRDVEILSSLSDPLDQIEHLLKGIKLERKAGLVLDPRELVSMDFFFIGVHRMITSGFMDIKLRAICSEGHTHSYVVNLASLDFIELDVDLPVYIETGNERVKEVVLMPDTVARMLEARELGLFGEDTPPLKMLALSLAGYVDSKGSRHDLGVKEAIDLLEDLPAAILDPIDHYAGKLTAGVRPIEFKCKTCGGEFSTPVGNLLGMVTPFRRSPDSFGVKVRFGDSRSE